MILLGGLLGWASAELAVWMFFRRYDLRLETNP